MTIAGGVILAISLVIVSLASAGATPVLSVEGQTLKWSGNSSGERFIVERKPGPSFTNVIGKSYTPPADPGHTDSFRVRPAASPKKWSNEVSITWPKEEPPTVKTEPASAVAPTAATLNALVNPNGSEVTECTLEYGTAIPYTKSAPCSPAPGSGTGNVAVSAAITGLSENTTYHFRVLAKNAGGTSEGADAEFKTTSTPVKPAEDSFNRTVASGWGSAEAGAWWTVVGSPWNWSVSPGAGNVNVGANGEERAYLSSFTVRDVDVRDADRVDSHDHHLLGFSHDSDRKEWRIGRSGCAVWNENHVIRQWGCDVFRSEHRPAWERIHTHRHYVRAARR